MTKSPEVTTRGALTMVPAEKPARDARAMGVFDAGSMPVHGAP